MTATRNYLESSFWTFINAPKQAARQEVLRNQLPTDTRQCKQCKEHLPLNAFRLGKTPATVVQTCTPCIRAKQKATNELNAEAAMRRQEARAKFTAIVHKDADVFKKLPSQVREQYINDVVELYKVMQSDYFDNNHLKAIYAFHKAILANPQATPVLLNQSRGI
jgi:hypothetical protein